MTRGSGVREIVLLTLGWEDLPRSVSIEGAPPEERMREPVPGILLHCDGGWLLLDTGFNTALLHDAALRRRYHGNPVHRAILPGPGEPLEEALAHAGIDAAEVHAVGLSHLHLDHAGGLRHFTGVPVHCQRRELEFGLTPAAEQHAIFRIDFDDPRHDWRLADGDAEIAPGVTAVLTAGHTPGHQSFVVDLDDSVGGGGFVFAFDAADLTENITDDVSIGGRVDASPEECREQVHRLRALAAERGYPLVPGHDPVVWPALTGELSERFGRTAREAHVSAAAVLASEPAPDGTGPPLLEEEVPGGAAWSLVLRRQEVLRLEAVTDGACVSLLLHAARRPLERLCVPDTMKAQMQARVRAPMVLMSDAGRALASVVGSSLDWHDCLTGHSTDAHLLRFGVSDYATDRNGWRQSARAGLLDELAKHGLDGRDLAPTVNLFTKVVPADDARGTLTFVPGHGTAGDWVELRAELAVLVTLSTAPHPLDPRTSWSPSPVRVSVRRGSAPGPDDASRAFRPESARALAESERTER